MNTLFDELTSNRAVRIAVVAALALLALFLLAKTWEAFFERDMNDSFYTISVEGTGSATAIPDTARITFSVIESATDVAAAQDAATRRTDAALEAMKGMGIEEEDLKTLGYSVSPRYEYGNQSCFNGFCPPSGSPRISGYDVTQTVEVRVRDTAKAGEALAALGGLGVQNIAGPEFVVDDQDAVRAEARAEAVAEAREKAEALADELGVRLGKVTSFYEGGSGGPMYDYGGTMMEAAQSRVAPTLPVGQSETEVIVTVTYEIK